MAAFPDTPEDVRLLQDAVARGAIVLTKEGKKELAAKVRKLGDVEDVTVDEHWEIAGERVWVTEPP